MATEIARIAHTESLFRDVNERIAETAERLGSEDAEFVCECADAGCDDRVQAQLEEYEEVRADGVRFLVAPGHVERDYERVVQRNGEYHVVAKTKDRQLARAVKELDPRASDSPPEDRVSEI